MQQRIFRSFWLSALAALVLSTIVSLLVYYDFYNVRVREVLLVQAEALSLGLSGMDKEDETSAVSYLESYRDRLASIESGNTRLTLVEMPQGRVIYDSMERAELMPAHLDRPEIQAAAEEGFGTAVRHSSTIGVSTHYAAAKTTDGRWIVRVSRDSAHLSNIFIRMIPMDLLSVLLLFAAAVFFSKSLTRWILKPLNAMGEQLRAPGSAWQLRKQMRVYPELEPFIQSVEMSEQVRAEFSANVSHELKTPLTSILGFAELMKSGMVRDLKTMLEFSEKIYAESQRLLSLIDDIMRLSRMDEGAEKDMSMEPVAMEALAREIMQRLSPRAEKNHIQLNLSGTDYTLQCYRTQLEELLYNLLDNSIKYNHEEGHVYLKLGVSGQGEPWMTVTDDGIGIAPEQQGRIWERFYRVDKSHSRAVGGTGLGLSIVKHIVEIHEGRIELSSAEGKGCRITVHFPGRLLL